MGYAEIKKLRFSKKFWGAFLATDFDADILF